MLRKTDSSLVFCMATQRSPGPHILRDSCYLAVLVLAARVEELAVRDLFLVRSWSTGFPFDWIPNKARILRALPGGTPSSFAVSSSDNGLKLSFTGRRMESSRSSL